MDNGRNPQPSFQLGFGVTYGKGPDGNYYIITNVTVGTVSQSFGVPLDQAEAFIDGYRNNFRDVVRAAKREQMGLIVADGSPNGLHN